MTNIAHYPGDCTNYDPKHYVGADTAGAFYRPTGATHNAETNSTAIAYKPILRHDMPEYAEDHGRQTQDRDRIMRLFGGHW